MGTVGLEAGPLSALPPPAPGKPTLDPWLSFFPPFLPRYFFLSSPRCQKAFLSLRRFPPSNFLVSGKRDIYFINSAVTFFFNVSLRKLDCSNGHRLRFVLLYVDVLTTRYFLSLCLMCVRVGISALPSCSKAPRQGRRRLKQGKSGKAIGKAAFSCARKISPGFSPTRSERRKRRRGKISRTLYLVATGVHG